MGTNVTLLIETETKYCGGCNQDKPVGEFSKNRSNKGGLQSQCRECRNRYQAGYQKTGQGREVQRKSSLKRYNTLPGRLCCIFHHMNRRCNNPNHKYYYRYGGRGIQNRFTSLDDFRDYVINILGIIHIDQIEGLEIDRIDNDDHYEKGNIRFVTPKENANNRGSNS